MSEFRTYAVGETIGDHLVVTDVLSEVSERHPVYRAFDKRAWGPVVVKVFRNARKARQEFELIASLAHPNIIRAYGVYEPDIMLTEVLRGPTLDRVARQEKGNRLGLQDAIRCAIYTGAALDHVHSKGWVHLDVKPSNVALVDRRVVLFDFGSARKIGDTNRPPVVQGTDPYMSPEESLLGDVSPASDVFGLGATLFELMTGKLPFDEVRNGVYPQTREKARSLRKLRPRAPARLEQLVAACLERDPDARPKLAQLLPELNAFLNPSGRMWPDYVDFAAACTQTALAA